MKRTQPTYGFESLGNAMGVGIFVDRPIGVVSVGDRCDVPAGEDVT
jgi:hypothetical protein